MVIVTTNKMNKPLFRARQLEAWKPIPIYMSEELPDLPEYSAINRTVPQMPTGMNKEEECEHHLQRAISAGMIIPIPEVTRIDHDVYNKLYPTIFKVPRQLIHVQPYSMEQDIIDYDMDSEDEAWVNAQVKTLDITLLKFEEIMDRLEKNSGHSVVTQAEAKILLKDNDEDQIIAVYDYWLNKRLKTKQHLIPCVKTEAHRSSNSNNDPYIAFRRRIEKMQTRKNRKNDETSYEKMLKLRRDLCKAVTLLKLVQRRESMKKELINLTIKIYEKRYQAEDWSGQLLTDVTAMKNTRAAFAPLYTNQLAINQTANWVNKQTKEDLLPRKEKRTYKKRKHKLQGSSVNIPEIGGISSLGDDVEALQDITATSPTPPPIEEAPFAFRRSKLASYLPPIKNRSKPYSPKDDSRLLTKCRFHPFLINTSGSEFIISARGRFGRCGRLVFDRGYLPGHPDDFWEACDYKIQDNYIQSKPPSPGTLISTEGMKIFRPKTPPRNLSCEDSTAEELQDITIGDSKMMIQVDDLTDLENLAPTQLNMNDELFPGLGFCGGNLLELDQPLFLELNVNSNSTPMCGINQKDTLDNSLLTSLPENTVNKAEQLGELSEDLLNVDIKDLVGSSSILYNKLSDNTNVSSINKDNIFVNSDNCFKNNTNNILQESKPDINVSFLDKAVGQHVDDSKNINQVKNNSNKLTDSVLSDDFTGHSAFKTVNSELILINHICNEKVTEEVGNVNDLAIRNRYLLLTSNIKNSATGNMTDSNLRDQSVIARTNTSSTHKSSTQINTNFLQTKLLGVKSVTSGIESSNGLSSNQDTIDSSAFSNQKNASLGERFHSSTQN